MRNADALRAKSLAYARSHPGELLAYRSRPAVRERRAEKSREYRKTNPEKCRARRAVGYAVDTGRLIPGPCVVCGTRERIEAHHLNGYTRAHWLDVEWRCREHHVS